MLRHQSGSNYARTIAIPNSTGLITSNGSTTAYVEAMDANREDDIWVFDVRADKTVNFTDRVRARLFFDLFNITNSHSSETISRATGTGTSDHPRFSPRAPRGSASGSSGNACGEGVPSRPHPVISCGVGAAASSALPLFLFTG